MRNLKQDVYRLVACGIGVCVVASLCGCSSTRKMALKKEVALTNLEARSIGMFTLRLSNQYKPRVVPQAMQVRMIHQSSGETTKFAIDWPHDSLKKGYFEYLISVDLEPGTYTVGDVLGAGGAAFVLARFKFPVDTQFELPPGSVVYLGHVVMTNRKRGGEEPRSGPLFPLLDQALSGFYNGTFDITVTDRSDSDIPTFKKAYPWLEKHPVKNAIMTK